MESTRDHMLLIKLRCAYSALSITSSTLPPDEVPSTITGVPLGMAHQQLPSSVEVSLLFPMEVLL